MQTKKLKNYIILALIVVVGLFTLWEELTLDNDVNEGSSLQLVEETTLQEIDRDEDITSGQSSETQTQEQSQEQTQEQTTLVDATNEALYQETLEEIRGYNDIRQVLWLSEVEAYVQRSYDLYARDGWQGLVDGQTDGTKAGGTWRNYDDQLPKVNLSGDEVTYKEFDVNNKMSGRSRDAERFVTGSDGSVYYTYDHYDSFIRIIE